MCQPATLAIPLMLTISETIKPSTVILQMRTNTSFANNPLQRPKNLAIIASILFQSKAKKKLQYHIPLILKCAEKGFSSFSFPTTNKFLISLLFSRTGITATVSLQGMTTWYSFRSPSVDVLESHRPIQECLLIAFG